MSQSLSLADMSIEEKLETMEELWDDLVSHAEHISSPEWHKPVLDERERALQESGEQPVDWKAAKTALKNETE